MAPFIVAEMGASHNQNLDRAMRLIESAARSGANAIKLQTFTPDSMVADKNYVIKNGPWSGKNLYSLYQEAALPLAWHRALFQAAKDSGIECFSSPFSQEAVDFLESLGCARYKIASFELTDLELIESVAKTGKELIFSTGMASVAEIASALDICEGYGKKVTLLKCVSAYPASASDYNLLTIPDMRERFNCRVGVSDHTRGVVVPMAATALGATVIEKHLRLDSEVGPDSHFAADAETFWQMVVGVQSVAAACGKVQYGLSNSESNSFELRRSVYALQDIHTGELFTTSNTGLRRPAKGAHPKDYRKILGSKAKKLIKAGSPIESSFTG